MIRFDETDALGMKINTIISIRNDSITCIEYMVKDIIVGSSSALVFMSMAPSHTMPRLNPFMTICMTGCMSDSTLFTNRYVFVTAVLALSNFSS